MNVLKRWLVWLSRMHKCWGFGIQSPTDYAFVRYVVNEQWPYYAYDVLRTGNWLDDKLGRLFLRLSNWRQPSMMLQDNFQLWWQAGCKKTQFVRELSVVELARIDIEDTDTLEALLFKCNEQSVLVVQGIWRDKQRWHEIEHDTRTGTTFDLYYCGIVFFDTKRYKHNYIINF